jgi:hypothetical protein
MDLIGSQSRFTPGSTGTAHGVGLATGSQLVVEVLACDDECRRCSFRGPVRGESPVVSQRCFNDTNATCTADTDCPGATGPCRFIFPPITSEIFVPTCSLVYFEPVAGPDPSPVQGVIDLFTGEADFSVMNLRVAVSLANAPDAPTAACVNCLGDAQPFDGVAGGTCEFGGQACDVHGVGTALANATSFDCELPPNPPINIPLPVSGTSTASKQWTLDDSRPRCTDEGTSTAEPCWCGACPDGTPCFADNQCPMGTTCGFVGPSPDFFNVTNNACNASSTDTCNWDPETESGTCADDPTIGCFPDGVDGETIIATGTAEVNEGSYIIQIANLVCLPSFGVPLIDNATGLPGPLLFEARFDVTPRGQQ